MSESFAGAENLSPSKKALLDLYLEKEAAADIFPLSYAQQRLWFLDQLESGNPAYNIRTAFKLRGELNIPALAASFQELIRRHESLRTTFSVADEQPVQVIAPMAAFSLPLIDLTHLPEIEREREATQLINSEARRSFDLSRGPLLRPSLVRLYEREHLLLLTMHHIISDGWSMGIIFRELTMLYRAFVADEASPLPELEIQYADYAVWQRERMTGAALSEQLSYWKQQLQNAPALLDLPTDHPRPPQQGYQGRRLECQLPLPLTTAIKQLSREEGATLFMTLLAGWQLLMSRYSGQPEVVVGTAVANRERRELEGIVGALVNLVALRVEVRGAESFRQLLARVKEVCVGGYRHQEVPFEEVLQAVGVERNTSYHPIFQVVFELQNTPVERLQLPDLEWSRVTVESETAKFDLMMLLEESTEGLTGWLEYNTDLFNAGTIERMTAHYRELLESITRNPDLPVSQLRFLSDDERRFLLVDCNATAAPVPSVCVHQLFEQQVERTPNAVALVHEADRLTYAELNTRANRLAHHLISLGVGPESLVGILMDRSIEMVVSLLATLKAGGAYLPLDPSYPRERVSFMIEDAGVKVLLTEKTLPDTELANHNPATRISADNLAYVIYTSGSTGVPKGVMITHSSLTNFLTSMLSEPGLSSDDTLSAVTTLSFDIAGLELYLPLIAGATLDLVSRDVATDGLALVQHLSRSATTIMQATPATWRLLIAAGWSNDDRLKVLCGGEALGLELAQQLRSRSGEVWNLYGPTETTIWSTRCKVEALAETTPIGRPIANTEIYIVDDEMQPVPVGVRGQLLIGGVGLARGYLGRAELTADRFVPDGLSGKAGARLYRTGDVARYLADGAIEYVGRSDEQVKVRGYRIELGEVEHVLEQQPEIKQAVVVARGREVEDRQLVAYVVSASELNVSELRARLRERLPEYMVPAVFMELDQLPLTANGKVDRRSLPEPEVKRSDLDHELVAPRTSVEEILMKHWQELLGVEQISIYDSFFDLGGHSLLATRLVLRVRKEFNVELPLQSLFASPALASMARQIEKAQRSHVPPLLPAPRSGLLQLSYPQLRLWFLTQLDQHSPAYNIRVAVRLAGPLNVTALAQSLTDIVRRHESLRTSFVMQDGEPVQVIGEPTLVPVEVDDLEPLPESEREAEAKRLVADASQTPFDLARGIMLRARLLRLAAEDHVLVMTTHHIASDGWSIGVLFRELGILYSAFGQGQQSPLADLSLQYADFAQWQRGWLQGGLLEEQLGYWERQLSGLAPELELPTDRPRSATENSSWGMPYYLELSPELSGSLKELCRREGATLFMVLLAAFQTLLHRYTGQDDIAVGTPVANRMSSETENLIGFFVNTLVMRSDFSGAPGFRELLSRVRRLCIDAYAHQDVPFEKIVERLQPERQRKHNPLFQVLFQVQNAPMEALSLDGLNVSPVMIEGGMVKLDLAMTVKEVAGRLVANLRYNTDLFDAATIERMAGHFRQLLESITRNPDLPVSQLQLLSEDERRFLLVDCNNTAAPGPSLCLHQLFEQQVERTPDAVALVHEADQLTYAELNSRANRLAHHLISLGVGPESLVGILMDRSIEMVVSLLATLKAGGAYLPLDPSYPRERVSFMIEDAGVKVLLTPDTLETGFADHNPAARIDAENLAYVIYTSGSTGVPKGVMIPHRAASAFTLSAAEVYDIKPADRVLQFASFSFDTSVEEIFPCLTRGAALVLRTDDMLSTAADFLRQCAELQVSVLDLPTAYWHQLTAQMSAEELELPASLRLMIIGGESAAPGRVLQWQQRVKNGARLVNTYGPTEATVVATFAEMGAEVSQSGVTIGRGLPHVTCYVLDGELQPVPMGVKGELYVGGEGIGRGYSGRGALTAERFVPDPFSTAGGERLYRTGDEVRWLANGELEFIGRVDDQVKVRGYRVELGEVEAAISRQQTVRECAVALHADTADEKRLIGYLVTDDTTDLNQLRQQLRAELPDYMVPSVLVRVTDLPRMPNGKVNRRALNALAGVEPESDRPFVAPRTPLEEELAEIWRQLLKVEKVGVYDNFFELGGHSLLLTQLASRIRSVFHVDVQLRELFSAPTLEENLKLIAAKQIELEDAVVVAQFVEDLKNLSADEIKLLLEAEASLTSNLT